MKRKQNKVGIAALFMMALALFGIVAAGVSVAEKETSSQNAEELIASADISEEAKVLLLQAVENKTQGGREDLMSKRMIPQIEVQYKNTHDAMKTAKTALGNDLREIVTRLEKEKKNPQYYRKIDTAKKEKTQEEVEKEEMITTKKRCAFSNSQRFEKIACSEELSPEEQASMGLVKQNIYYPQDIKANTQLKGTPGQIMSVAGISVTGKGTKIALIDTGINPFHADLQGVVTEKHNFVDDNPFDMIFHGTFIAGQIASQGVKDSDSIGLAPDAKLMVYKVVGENGATSTDIAEAIYLALERGATATSISLGTILAYDQGCDYTDPAMSEAINTSVRGGVHVYIASGNYNQFFHGMASPACMTNAFSVGASDFNDKVADFSGRTPLVVAPGVGIRSTGPYHAEYSQYPNMSGTSMAAPEVAALDALLSEANPKLSAYYKKLIILITADDDIDEPGWDVNSGYGRINVSLAVKIALIFKALTG